MGRPDAPTGIIASNSDITLALLRIFIGLGIAYPRDVSLIAFDAPPWAEVLTPPLTVVAPPVAEIARKTWELLQARMEGAADGSAGSRSKRPDRARVARPAASGAFAPPRGLTSMHAGHVPTSAALLIVGATLCFSSLDSIVKYLAPNYPIPLLVWARWMFQVAATALWLGPQMGLNLVRTKRPKLQIARGITLVLCGLLFMTALKSMPLADATALNYTCPVLVLIISRVYLRERLTPARIAFIAVGMIGMLLIVQPGSEIFRGASLLVLLAACIYAMYQILTRLAADEDPRVSLFYPSLISIIMLTAAAPVPAHPSRHADARRAAGRCGRDARHARSLPVHPCVPARSGFRAHAFHVHAARVGDAARMGAVRRPSRRPVDGGEWR
jgi:threonine/homoserine efflux transporter RhtA